MPNPSPPTRTFSPVPRRPGRGRQRALRWATVTLLLLLAAVTASGA